MLKQKNETVQAAFSLTVKICTTQLPDRRWKTYRSIYHNKTTKKPPKRNYKPEAAKLGLLRNRNYNR